MEGKKDHHQRLEEHMAKHFVLRDFVFAAGSRAGKEDVEFVAHLMEGKFDSFPRCCWESVKLVSVGGENKSRRLDHPAFGKVERAPHQTWVQIDSRSSRRQVVAHTPRLSRDASP